VLFKINIFLKADKNLVFKIKRRKLFLNKNSLNKQTKKINKKYFLFKNYFF